MPAVVELVKKKFPDSNKVNFAIAFITSIIVGAITTLLAGEFSVSELLGSVGAVFAASQVIYNLYWKGSRLEARVLGKKFTNEKKK